MEREAEDQAKSRAESDLRAAECQEASRRRLREHRKKQSAVHSVATIGRTVVKPGGVMPRRCEDSDSSREEIVEQQRRANRRIHRLFEEQRRREEAEQMRLEEELRLEAERLASEAERVEEVRERAARNAVAWIRKARDEERASLAEREAAERAAQEKRRRYRTPRAVAELKSHAAPMPRTAERRRQKRLRRNVRHRELRQWAELQDVSESEGGHREEAPCEPAQIVLALKQEQDKAPTQESTFATELPPTPRDNSLVHMLVSELNATGLGAASVEVVEAAAVVSAPTASQASPPARHIVRPPPAPAPARHRRIPRLRGSVGADITVAIHPATTVVAAVVGAGDDGGGSALTSAEDAGTLRSRAPCHTKDGRMRDGKAHEKTEGIVHGRKPNGGSPAAILLEDQERELELLAVSDEVAERSAEVVISAAVCCAWDHLGSSAGSLSQVEEVEQKSGLVSVACAEVTSGESQGFSRLPPIVDVGSCSGAIGGGTLPAAVVACLASTTRSTARWSLEGR
eukprot:TRINITY_DN4989_c0_g1_i1.p1 TRINITY_DN4989_c0_g1~~TRINITY_DN4989_c0_g1_i1.p1  ORF type:complete len:516 (+),score=105.93 TRINITY_DN4989_c0_g1_i1:574-2121(+)